MSANDFKEFSAWLKSTCPSEAEEEDTDANSCGGGDEASSDSGSGVPPVDPQNSSEKPTKEHDFSGDQCQTCGTAGT